MSSERLAGSLDSSIHGWFDHRLSTSFGAFLGHLVMSQGPAIAIHMIQKQSFLMLLDGTYGCYMMLFDSTPLVTCYLCQMDYPACVYPLVFCLCKSSSQPSLSRHARERERERFCGASRGTLEDADRFGIMCSRLIRTDSTGSPNLVY